MWISPAPLKRKKTHLPMARGISTPLEMAPGLNARYMASSLHFGSTQERSLRCRASLTRLGDVKKNVGKGKGHQSFYALRWRVTHSILLSGPRGTREEFILLLSETISSSCRGPISVYPASGVLDPLLCELPSVLGIETEKW